MNTLDWKIASDGEEMRKLCKGGHGFFSTSVRCEGRVSEQERSWIHYYGWDTTHEKERRRAQKSHFKYERLGNEANFPTISHIGLSHSIEFALQSCWI